MQTWIAAVAGAGAAVVVGASALVLTHRSPSAGPQPAREQVAHADQPQVECRNERVVTREEWGTNSILGTMVGGAAGGALGNQFGKGSGKTAMTAAGAVGGAVAGHEIANDNYPDERVSYQRRCHTVR